MEEMWSTGMMLFKQGEKITLGDKKKHETLAFYTQNKKFFHRALRHDSPSAMIHHFDNRIKRNRILSKTQFPQRRPLEKRGLFKHLLAHPFPVYTPGRAILQTRPRR